MRVIIADDEKWVCQLIYSIVDWEALDMTVIGQAEDGIGAFALLCAKKPDIVITDIRMPGMDGLEMIRRAREMGLDTHFIVISGFKHFEYAYSALKFGVDGYLLKPINGGELTAMLQKIRDEQRKITSVQDEEENIRSRLERSIGELCRQYLGRILSGTIDASKQSLEDINKEYQTTFAEGLFQILELRLDQKESGNEDGSYACECREKFCELLSVSLAERCHCVLTIDAKRYLINYDPTAATQIRRGLKHCFDDYKRFLETPDYYEASIGIGMAVVTLGQLMLSGSTAHEAAIARILEGPGIIDYILLDYEDYADNEIISEQSARELENLIETLDINGVQEYINQLFAQLKKKDGLNPRCYFTVVDRVSRVFIEATNRMNLKVDIHTMPPMFTVEDFEPCGCVAEIRAKLQEYMREKVQYYIDLLSARNYAPIRQVKAYVAQHYGEPVTLEEVGGVVNLNPVYLSTLFKKETGINFSEYVANYRIDVAKEMLLKSQRSVAEIAEYVGYANAKSFSRLFKKQVGIYPVEYRRVHA